jgi:hypothetical protein
MPTYIQWYGASGNIHSFIGPPPLFPWQRRLFLTIYMEHPDRVLLGTNIHLSYMGALRQGDNLLPESTGLRG